MISLRFGRSHLNRRQIRRVILLSFISSARICANYRIQWCYSCNNTDPRSNINCDSCNRSVCTSCLPRIKVFSLIPDHIMQACNFRCPACHHLSNETRYTPYFVSFLFLFNSIFKTQTQPGTSLQRAWVTILPRSSGVQGAIV